MTKTLKKLFDALIDGNFHSGEQLGKALGLTRSAIWKHIKQLNDWDLEIESITNKGYRIKEVPTLLKKEKILSFIQAEQQAQLADIEIFDTVPSTNDYLLNTLPERSKKNYACFSERQTKGKGRHGRLWVSPFGKNIYLSLLWHFSQDASTLSGLSLAIAIAIVETLRAYGITQNLGIKWPNDVLCENQKLAGILIELRGEANGACSAVIGVGLNVHMTSSHLTEITQAWTSIQDLSKDPVDRNQLAGSLLNALVKALTEFQREGLKAFIEKWQTLDLSFNKPVSVITANTSIQGIGRGINEDGFFNLETDSGIKHFSSGEISMRILT